MRLNVTLFLVFLFSLLEAQNYRNPIIPGFNPDPSICKAGNNYYLVTSSFEYFPGIPIYHSNDLVSWKMVGHVLNRESQINMEGYPASEGVYAPTIRYHDGTFYVVVSVLRRNPRRVKNILITADSLMSHWSDPVEITNSSLWGIDPSLFFDDDGKCYFTANRKHQVAQPYSSYREIVLQELDLRQMQLTGPTDIIGKAALVGGATAEGPHIYKKDGYYYLLISEGGTRTNHAVTISRSEKIRGPYEQCPYNPILTHRHLQETISLRNIGHADIIQTQNNEWWMVCLGVRFTNDWSLMGRETFLVPMIWPDNSFPIINPGNGLVQMEYPLPAIAKEADNLINTFFDDFSTSTLKPEWTFLRNNPRCYEFTDNRQLKIDLKKTTMADLSSPAFMGKRIENSDFETTIKLSFTATSESEEAGLVLLSNNENYFRFTLSKSNIQLIETINGRTIILAKELLEYDKYVYLKVLSKNSLMDFYYSKDGRDWHLIKKKVNTSCLRNYKYTGNFIGLYGTSDGEETTNHFFVDWFKYHQTIHEKCN
ncbi:glycoside hydrolase family 43 protein [Sunxiuqinia indica]|uniref:glycoside hydrolase family 43 protein n=1 Tax=Sunxiuqinia indica TaxID=2692584 RepID=UPI00135B3477|nr:glycoside hydrolase family 43 protein [Sunxiuqinia indica]